MNRTKRNPLLLSPVQVIRKKIKMSVIIEYDGKKFEFRGEYRNVEYNEWFLGIDGTVCECKFPLGALANPVAILHLVPDILEFGGIKFVKTGERRMPLVDEWYLSAQTKAPVFCSGTSKWHYAANVEILKPADENQGPVCEANKEMNKDKKNPCKTYSILLSAETVKRIVDEGDISFRSLFLRRDIISACREVLGKEDVLCQ